MQNNDTSGKRIRKLIDRRGVTDKSFAQLIQTNPQTLSHILCDKYVVSPKMAAKIAYALNTTPEYILCQTNDPGGDFVGSDNGYNTDINKNDLENIGKRLRTLIERKGMLKKDFASLAGITPQTLSKIINGKYTNLSPRLVEKFSQLLNTNINYILCKSDNPCGDNFLFSDAWVQRNTQYFYISGVISYLESLGYTITELLTIGNLEFARDKKTLMFSTLASKRDLSDYGFELENISNIDDVIKYETTEDILVKIVEETDTLVQHCWKIEFQDTCKQIDEQKFLDIMYSFSMITQNYFNMALYDFNKINAVLSDLGRAIQKKKSNHIF